MSKISHEEDEKFLRLGKIGGRDQEDHPQRYRVHLRDVTPDILSPGSFLNPSFRLGPTPGFRGKTLDRPANEKGGHMAPSSMEGLKADLKEASKAQDPRTRDTKLDHAASRVTQAFLGGEVPKETATSVIREARGQVVFHAKELAKQAGLTGVGAQVVGYGLERALERQGFKVLASHAVDKVASYAKEAGAKLAAVATAAPEYRVSAASVASRTGIRHQMEQGLQSSVKWLTEHGVTREAVKGVIAKHAGKFAAVIELSQRPELVERGAQLIAHSDSAVDAIRAVATDKELRHSVGTLTLATGEAVMTASKSAGSIAIVAGSLLRGDSAKDIGRNIFRAAMSILGGAAGGMAGLAGGPAALATGVIGAEMGARLADKILETYDKVTGHEGPQNQKSLVSTQEIKDSAQVIEQKGHGALVAEAKSLGGRGRSEGFEMAHNLRP